MCSPILESAAFSLIEILVTVALLTIIILGLVAMFNQTRRAFTSSLTQVDVLASGRAAADRIAREIEQLTPSDLAYGTNFYVDTAAAYLSANSMPLRQPLVDPNDIRTNTIQELYFLTTTYNQSHNLQYNVIGYKVSTPAYGIGSLYRFSSTNISPANLTTALTSTPYLWSTFINTDPTTAGLTNFSRIIDGVINFRIRAYDTNGSLFSFKNLYNSTNLEFANNYADPFLSDYFYSFGGNSVPAYVEIELGIVEDRTLAKYEAITNGGVAPGISYLINHPGQVHIFRQRIPIRNVNPAAYQ